MKTENYEYIEFWGGLNKVKIINNRRHLPRQSSYICFAEGYDIYDSNDPELDEFLGVRPINWKVLDKWNK